jgi:hypothetical protein
MDKKISILKINFQSGNKTILKYLINQGRKRQGFQKED